uniref:Putative secreted protein n=1 Tax=Ixodes ricinus TaxID=34613 RepID=A0A6B0UDU7_IXORI
MESISLWSYVVTILLLLLCSNHKSNSITFGNNVITCNRWHFSNPLPHSFWIYYHLVTLFEIEMLLYIHFIRLKILPTTNKTIVTKQYKRMPHFVQTVYIVVCCVSS